jgi:hypothetical protein
MRSVRTSALFLVCVPLALRAQLPDFSHPVWTSPVEFTSVASVRELSDGRLIVPDPGEREIKLLSAQGTLLSTNAHRGGGPQEFQMPLWTLAMPGDTTWVVDREQERFLVLGPDGTAIRTVPWPRIDGGGLRSRVLADGAGHVIFTQDGFPRPGVTETPLLRWEPRTGKLDTLATLRTPSVARYKLMFEGHEALVTRALPYAEGHSWAAGSRGSIAVIDPEHYVVRWRSPTGALEAGRPIPFTPVPVTQADRDRYLEGENAATQAHLTFPAMKPAVRAFTSLISPSGELWAWRYGAATLVGATWDVIDQTGRRLRSVELSANREIIGFGARTVYVIRTDDDGIQHLEAYR